MLNGTYRCVKEYEQGGGKLSVMKKMKSITKVEMEFPDCHIEQLRCPKCGGILVTKFGEVSITICVEDECLYADYDYDFS